jgi:hypothetical protein
VTITTEIYERIRAEMQKANEESGYRKFRSVSHFVEYTIMNYEEGKKKKQ